MSERRRTDAGRGGEVGLVAHVAVAAERADGVDALTVAAQIWQHLALIDVCGRKTSHDCQRRRLPKNSKDTGVTHPCCRWCSPVRAGTSF